MSIFSKIKDRFTDSQSIPENYLYAFVAEEIERGQIDKGVMTKLLSETGFNKNKAMARYVKHRVKILKIELSETINPPADAATRQSFTESGQETDSILIEGSSAEELAKRYHYLWCIYKEAGLTDKAKEFLEMSNQYKMSEFHMDSETKDDIDWNNRILCSDESCIGIIGPDGCCKECGKPI